MPCNSMEVIGVVEAENEIIDLKPCPFCVTMAAKLVNTHDLEECGNIYLVCERVGSSKILASGG